jgi:type II secretion system protein N
MLKKTLRGLGGCIGYLLYAVGLGVLLLWLLFPHEALRRYLEESLNRVSPELRWQVEAVGLDVPAGLTLRAIEGFEQGDGKNPLLRIDVLTLRLNWAESLRARQVQIEYRMAAGKGSVHGFVRIDGGQQGLYVEGAGQDIELTAFPLLSRQLGRALQGSVSGTFTGTFLPAKGEFAELTARLNVDNGRLGLKRPILSHTELPFSQGTVVLHGRGERLQLEQGVVASELFDGQFSGTVIVNRDPALGQLDLKGAMQPTAKFYKGLNNTLALQAFRVQLKDNSLPFRISGELSNPGIHYEGYSQLFQTLEMELK